MIYGRVYLIRGIRPLIVGFKIQTKAQETRKQLSRLLGPRLTLKTH